MESESRTVIHIGLPKACSTYLQRSVTGLTDIRVLEHPKLLKLRLAAFGDVPERPVINALREELENIQHGGVLLISDERLSSWRHTDFRWLDGRAVKSYQERCATLLKSAFGNSRILMLTRNPRAWLASIHAQYVKAGESRSLADFCEHNRGYLIQASRLDDLVAFYSKQFGSSSVSVFPVEASDTAEAGDWRDWVSNQCGSKIAWPERSRYRSLDPELRAAQLNMNRIIERLAGSSAATSSELAALKGEIFRFVERTLVDNAGNQRRLRRHIAACAGVQPGIPVRHQSPPEDLVDKILQGMTETLKRSEFKTVLPIYR